MSHDRFSLSSRAIHADDDFSYMHDVAPSIHVSTTFKYPKDPDQLAPLAHHSKDNYIYSREAAPNFTRLEHVLTSVIGGPTLTYSSGLAAITSAYVLLNPKRTAISNGYHGSHAVLKVMNRVSGIEKVTLDELDKLEKGDVIHVETPVNPTGEARNLAYYAQKAKEIGAYVLVDATFAPPSLQDPFAFGADIVMHSGTKYFGGHSDLLCGTLSVRKERKDWFDQLFEDRAAMGNVMGSIEGWLGLRSIRTMELRVTQQSKTATRLVQWLEGALKEEGSAVAKAVKGVKHASLQKDDMEWLSKQMPNGFGPVFSLSMKSEDIAKTLPSKLELFSHATSLGGVESLIEWRRMSDATVEGTVLRVSVGIESFNDLKEDLLNAFEKLINN